MAITIPIITDFDARGIKKAERAFGEMEKVGHKVGSALKSAFLPVGVALGGLAIAGAKFAMEAAKDAQSAALLARQLKVSTKATDAQVKSTEDFILKMSIANGVADDELRPALSKLTRGTHDLSKAQKLLTLSMDISKGSGKSLTQVTDSISKALGGNMTALARLSPEVKQMVKDHKSLNDILAALAKTYAGSAATAANTFQGRLDSLKITLKETQESIGYALMPIFESMVKFINDKIVPVIQNFSDKLGKDGLGKTLQNSLKDFGDWIFKAEGARGATEDFAFAIGALVLAFKGLAFMSGVASTLTAVSTAMSGLAGVIPSLAGAGLGLIAAAIGLVVINLAALFALLRDNSDRNYILAAVLDFTSLIADAFIGMYKAIRLVVNNLAGAGNWLTSHLGLGSQLSTLSDINFLSVDRIANMPTGASAPAMNMQGAGGSHGSGSGTIIVNTGVGDPVAIGKSVSEALDAYNRRTGK
jgi:hypothetical protein